MTINHRSITLLCILMLAPWIQNCGPVRTRQETAAESRVESAASDAGEEQEEDLARLMGELQRHSAKLGYAIKGRNRPLAEFYLEEVTEVMTGLETVSEHDGMPIAQPARTILSPVIEPLRRGLQASQWQEIQIAYEALIEGCNRCHSATEHAFIKILPASGEPPFNQAFDGE